MQKSPEELLAEMEAQNAELDAALKEVGLDLDAEGLDGVDPMAGYPKIVQVAYEMSGEALVSELKRLLDAGADPDAASPFGETALGRCFDAGEWAALRLLLRHGASVDDFRLGPEGVEILSGEKPDLSDAMLRDEAGRTPFLLACRVGNLAAAQAYLPFTPEAGRTATPDGEGPVWMAVRSRSGEMLDWTLAEGFEVNARTRFGGTPLLEAVESDYLDTARRLLEAGADLTLGNNVSESLKARNAEGPKSVFAKAADLIMARTPIPFDMPDTITTPTEAAHSPGMVRLLLTHGADPTEFDDQMMPTALGTDLIAPIEVSVEDFNSHGTVRAGKTNPEPYLPDFWREQIRTMRSGYSAEIEIAGKRDYACPSVPVWSFARFGRTATCLPDGRIVLIAGEHEDHYDPDFCIYADVTVLDGEGGVEHFIYPREVFPPTDFHTATFLGDHILMIGSLGYPEGRQEGVTQVLRLNLSDFSVHPVETGGDNPGWINRHKAVHAEDRIIVTGGKIEPGYRDNADVFELDLATMRWARITGRA